MGGEHKCLGKDFNDCSIYVYCLFYFAFPLPFAFLLIREHISQAIDGNKIMEMLDKIDSPTEYINAITKLLKLKIIESYKIEL